MEQEKTCHVLHPLLIHVDDGDGNRVVYGDLEVADDEDDGGGNMAASGDHADDEVGEEDAGGGNGEEEEEGLFWDTLVVDYRSDRRRHHRIDSGDGDDDAVVGICLSSCPYHLRLLFHEPCTVEEVCVDMVHIDDGVVVVVAAEIDSCHDVHGSHDDGGGGDEGEEEEGVVDDGIDLLYRSSMGRRQWHRPLDGWYLPLGCCKLCSTTNKENNCGNSMNATNFIIYLYRAIRRLLDFWNCRKKEMAILAPDVTVMVLLLPMTVVIVVVVMMSEWDSVSLLILFGFDERKERIYKKQKQKRTNIQKDTTFHHVRYDRSFSLPIDWDE